MVTIANVGCHLNGITEIPLKFKNPTVAVKIISSNVNIPP